MVIVWGLVIAFGVEDAVIAGLGLAIIAAAVPLAQLAFNLARLLPWPIYLVADLMVKAVEDVINSTVTWSNASAQGLADVIQLPWQAVWTVMRTVVESTEHLYWAVYRLGYVDIPHVVGWANDAIVGAERAAFAHADQLAQLGAQYAQQLATQAIQRADQEFAQALAHADQLAQQDALYAQQLAGEAISRADQEFGDAVAHADAVAAAVAGYAATLAGDAITEAITIGAQLGLELERVEQAGTEYTQQVAGDLAGDIAATAAAVEAYALALSDAVGARVTDLEDSPCQRFCAPLGDLGSLLQGLEDMGLAAILLALAQEALHDPGAVEQALEQLAVPVVKDIAGAFNLGIPA